MLNYPFPYDFGFAGAELFAHREAVAGRSDSGESRSQIPAGQSLAACFKQARRELELALSP